MSNLKSHYVHLANYLKLLSVKPKHDDNDKTPFIQDKLLYFLNPDCQIFEMMFDKFMGSLKNLEFVRMCLFRSNR